MVVSKKSTSAVFFALSTLLGLSSLTIPPTLAQTPSLGNGIVCVARGKTTQGNRIYLYTSVIDYNSIQKKQPVSVTINESMVTVEAEELVVVDSQANTLTIVDSVTGSPPEMQPVGRASTIYQGNNTFSGKTAPGTPVSFTLNNNFQVFKIKHGAEAFTGSCH
ncbi:MAG: hypothetical protein GC158_00955 [Cyanobacteria bacterium RI_101]|nr:hypothetical protein [Cyanobacteria bacterium RI_101]